MGVREPVASATADARVVVFHTTALQVARKLNRRIALEWEKGDHCSVGQTLPGFVAEHKTGSYSEGVAWLLRRTS